MTNNKRNYWFKRRRYGYGWLPVTWQGWTVLLVFGAVLIGGGEVLLKNAPRHVYSDAAGAYLALVLISTAVLVVIAYKKGPAPKWRWGKRDDDNPDEDY